MATQTHGYVCECEHRSCRQVVRLTEGAWTRLSGRGRIVSPRCLDSEHEGTLERGPGYVVIASKPNARPAVPSVLRDNQQARGRMARRRGTVSTLELLRSAA